jgi:gamma-glutamylcyclotransferase (GGCT)/AIG2-like uncharacterized protein YtfP
VNNARGPCLFVYGSLRSDARRDRPESRAAFDVLAAAAASEGAASLPGRLYAPAWYPGWTPAAKGRVTGELWRISDPQLLSRLDSYEGPAYLRERRQAVRKDGRRVTAWIYRYVAPITGVPVIPSGDYVQWLEASGSHS